MFNTNDDRHPDEELPIDELYCSRNVTTRVGTGMFKRTPVARCPTGWDNVPKDQQPKCTPEKIQESRCIASNALNRADIDKGALDHDKNNQV
jgi:hypothetical protein